MKAITIWTMYVAIVPLTAKSILSITCLTRIYPGAVALWATYLISLSKTAPIARFLVVERRAAFITILRRYICRGPFILHFILQPICVYAP